MKHLYVLGDRKTLQFTVGERDLAAFETGVVHEFYGTFALGRDVEWTCRQFVLDMKEDDEEGIGTFLNIKHHSPALLGEHITIEAEVILAEMHTLDCAFTVKVGERLVASGTQGQKILKKEKIQRMVASIKA